MNTKINTTEITENDVIILKIREAQVQQLYKQTWSGLAGILTIMFSICIALWQVLPRWELLSWAGIIILLCLLRSLLIIAFQHRKPDNKHIYMWARLHVTGATASGIMWALPPIFMWPADSPVHQMIWPVCIVSLAASVVSKYCVWTPAYLPYLLITLIPVSIRLFTGSGPVYTVLGILGIVLTAVLAHTGKLMHDASFGALVMSIHNEALNIKLSDEKEKAEELNAQLHLEVAERSKSQYELQNRNEELEKLNIQLTATKDRLESVNADLASALRDIKQLSGLLPICASCKKIRNDRGYWEQIETFIRNHSEVQFSHSICPGCLKKLYPDLYGDGDPDF